METEWKLREKKRGEVTLTNAIEIRIIELEKVKKNYERNKEDIKVQWMLFLNDPNSKEVEEIVQKNKNIKEATVIVKEMSEDEKMQRLAFLREKARLDEKEIILTATEKGMKQGIEQGIEQGIKQGIEQGEKRKSLEIVRELLKAGGMSIEQIEKITKVSKEEIIKIKNSIDN